MFARGNSARGAIIIMSFPGPHRIRVPRKQMTFVSSEKGVGKMTYRTFDAMSDTMSCVRCHDK